MKKGFALIMAMIFIVLVATIGALGLSFASKSVKQAGDVYLKEQAEVLAINMVDYVTMHMQMTDYSTSCLENVIVYYPNDTTPMFKMRAKINYVNRSLTNCSNILPGSPRIALSGATTDLAYNAGIVDVVVEGTEYSDPNLRYVYRTTVIP